MEGLDQMSWQEAVKLGRNKKKIIAVLRLVGRPMTYEELDAAIGAHVFYDTMRELKEDGRVRLRIVEGGVAFEFAK